MPEGGRHNCSTKCRRPPGIKHNIKPFCDLAKSCQHLSSYSVHSCKEGKNKCRVLQHIFLLDQIDLFLNNTFLHAALAQVPLAPGKNHRSRNV